MMKNNLFNNNVPIKEKNLQRIKMKVLSACCTMQPFLQILYLKNVHVHSQICQETKSGIANTE